MPQLDDHLKWCLKDGRRLKKTKPDQDLAQKHLQKSEYNYQVLQELEKLHRNDWAINVGFYSIYHCFLAILTKFGYESKNQACTMTVLMKLIEEKRLILDKDLLLQFDTLETEKSLASPTIRETRETITYGVETSIDQKQLMTIKQLIIKIQRETIRIIKE